MKFEGEVLDAVKKVLPEIDFTALTGEITLDVINTEKSKVLVTTAVRDKEVNAAVGRTAGEAETVLGRLLGEDFKGKKLKEGLPLLETRFTELSSRIGELEKDAKGLGEKDQKELTELRKLTGDQKSKIIELETSLTDADKKAKDEVAKLMLDAELDKAYESITWIDDVNPYAKKGLRDELFSKHTFKKEGDKVLVYDNEGNIIKDGAGQREAKSLFEEAAKNAKLFKMNGAAAPGAPIPGTPLPAGRALTAEEQAHLQKMKDYAAGKR